MRSRRVVSFVEGARADAGGAGLVGVPLINHALAEQGYDVTLNIGGSMIPSGRRLIERGLAVDVAMQSANYEILSHSAIGRWCLSPALLREASRQVASADCIFLHSLYSFPILLGYLLARIHRRPYAVWPHGVLAPPQRLISRRVKRAYDTVFGRRILDDANALIFTAHGERDEAAPLALTAPSVVIPHGIDVGEFSQLPEVGEFRQRYLDGFGGPLVLYLGRLNAKKGLDLLAMAMGRVVADMPEARLAIVGSGHPPAFTEQVNRWLHLAGIANNAVLTGVVGHATKLAALADADVLAMPSEAENFGFSMFEAMASRLPVVVSDAVNFALEVQKHDAGIVVRRDPRELADALAMLLARPDLRKRMGANGFHLAQKYSWEQCGQRVKEMVEWLVAAQPLPSELGLLNG